MKSFNNGECKSKNMAIKILKRVAVIAMLGVSGGSISGTVTLNYGTWAIEQEKTVWVYAPTATQGSFTVGPWSITGTTPQYSNGAVIGNSNYYASSWVDGVGNDFGWVSGVTGPLTWHKHNSNVTVYFPAGWSSHTIKAITRGVGGMVTNNRLAIWAPASGMKLCLQKDVSCATSTGVSTWWLHVGFDSYSTSTVAAVTLTYPDSITLHTQDTNYQPLLQTDGNAFVRVSMSLTGISSSMIELESDGVGERGGYYVLDSTKKESMRIKANKATAPKGTTTGTILLNVVVR